MGGPDSQEAPAQPRKSNLPTVGTGTRRPSPTNRRILHSAPPTSLAQLHAPEGQPPERGKGEAGERRSGQGSPSLFYQETDQIPSGRRRNAISVSSSEIEEPKRPGQRLLNRPNNFRQRVRGPTADINDLTRCRPHPHLEEAWRMRPVKVARGRQNPFSWPSCSGNSHRPPPRHCFQSLACFESLTDHPKARGK